MPRTPRGPATSRTVLPLGSGVSIDTDTWEAIWVRTITEKQFQAIVVAHLRSRGWIVFTVPNMRLTTAGLPDLVCVHAGYPVVLFWELKAARTRVTPIQQAVIDVLQDVPGIDARIVRPSDWEALRDGPLAEFAARLTGVGVRR